MKERIRELLVEVKGVAFFDKSLNAVCIHLTDDSYYCYAVVSSDCELIDILEGIKKEIV